MSGKVVFGYVHRGSTPDLPTYVRPGVEARFLIDEAFWREDIVIGARSYRIAGRKGDIVNWLVAHGLQQVRIDRANAAYASHRLVISLQTPERKLHEIVGEAVGKLAGHFMPHGPVASVWEARERVEAAYAYAGAGRDAYAESRAPSHAGTGGPAPDAPVATPMAMPWLTPPRIIDIGVAMSRMDEETALRIWKPVSPAIDFSSLASWLRGG